MVCRASQFAGDRYYHSGNSDCACGVDDFADSSWRGRGVLPNHSPLQVAESYKLLEAIHPGRIDLGIGRAPGTDPLTALALRRSRKALTADDFLEQLGELIAWGGGEFPAGDPFRGIRAMPDDRPLPPIFLLGSSDYERTGGGDGSWIRVRGTFQSGPAGLSDAGLPQRFFYWRSPEKPHAILALSVFCAETEEAAQRMASSVLLSFAQLRTGHPGRMPSPEEALAHEYTPEQAAVVAAFKKLLIVGTPEQVRARIESVASRTEADEGK